MEANEEETVDSNELRDLLRKIRLFIGCSPLKMVEANFGCLDRDKICADIDAALAKPRCNCEVGSPEEQWKRFDEFCDAWQESAPVESCSDECPVIKMKNMGCGGCRGRSWCYALWAQMPYEEGDDK